MILEEIVIDGLVLDCSISSALAMEVLQFCTKQYACEKPARM